MNRKYDVCAIGNALVDYEIKVSDGFFEKHKVEKGLMTLVDADRQDQLIHLLEHAITKRQGGGSAANTIFGLSELGGKGFYTCKVADDQDGKFFMEDLNRAGVDTNLASGSLAAGITGKCLVMVTPDAERTMNTFLGIASALSTSELVIDAIAEANYVFLEGFLVSSPSGLEAMKEAKKIAEAKGTKTCITFSDPSMVKYFGSQMKEIIGSGMDLLFCNEEEAMLYTKTNSLEEAKGAIQKIAKQFAITLGEKGSLVYDGVRFIQIEAVPAKAIDSTGAGDMFAGAFLYGINNGLSYEQAGNLASAASAAIVGKYGPRFEVNQAKNMLNTMEV